MAHYSERPTFLGGDRANLDWVDLRADELLEATCSSMPRAGLLIELVDEQIAAARWLGNEREAIAYERVKLVLGQMAGLPVIRGHEESR